MSEVRPTYDDEIDLFELFKTLWDSKWKIIATTFVAAVIGVVFSVVKPNSFEVSAPIQIAKPSVFLPYTSLNSLLKQKGFYFDKELNDKGYKFDNESIFNNFVVEFNDYEEMVDVLSEDEFIKQSVKDLDDIDKQKALTRFAQKFKIVPPSKKENWLLKFQWHDDYEGRRLFENALQKTLINIKKISKNNIDELAKVIERQNSYKLEKLQNNLNVINQIEKEKLRTRIQYLVEQSAIATELGIETNKLDTNLLNQGLQKRNPLSINPNGTPLSINPNKTPLSINPNDIPYYLRGSKAINNDIPYYLRGSKAINKEIALIKSRSDKDILIMADGYVETNKNIALIQNDMSASQLKDAAKLIENDNPKDWVLFDMQLAEAKSHKKWGHYIALSIVLGGMVGVIHVLISNAIRKRKGQLEKA